MTTSHWLHVTRQHVAGTLMAWLVHMYDMTLFQVWRLIHTYDVTHTYGDGILPISLFLRRGVPLWNVWVLASLGVHVTVNAPLIEDIWVYLYAPTNKSTITQRSLPRTSFQKHCILSAWQRFRFLHRSTVHMLRVAYWVIWIRDT